MKRWFAMTNSFAAPFFSDTNYTFVEAPDAKGALAKVKKTYDHPCGLYSAGIWHSADDYHGDKPPLVTWTAQGGKQ